MLDTGKIFILRRDESEDMSVQNLAVVLPPDILLAHPSGAARPAL